ncbi:16S rRNA (guanine(966)-N(2))-methyltransferase RsmD [Pseudoxanthomonas mexicana]|uniref:16S rRNA (guanine(966)-N(2))-methyltransferase RsmD n=1 Tax=Pseudoxanthomonas mexicana TaxID=128785 RepID=UPI00398B256C
MNARRGGRAAAGGQVRIIGGRWRGTRLDVPDSPGLRPSGDRVRETLFNWLMHALPGARVLDLFAGTGALGWEALSRGAATAVLVERDPALARRLREVAARLSAQDRAEIVNDDALAWLTRGVGGPFDIAFVDPPFAQGLWERALPALAPRLAPRAWIYVESPAGQAPPVPAEWTLHREGGTREVRFALYRSADGRGADTLPSPATVAEATVSQ